MKVSAKGIGFIGLPILLFGCLIIFTVCAASVDAFGRGLDTPGAFTSYSMDDGPVPSLGQLDCPSLISRNELGTAVVSVSNHSESGQRINLNISADQFVLTPSESDTKIALAPLESIEKKWSVRPEKVGSYLIWVRMSDLDPSPPSFYSETYCTIGIIDTYGLTADQFQTVGAASVVVGCVLVIIWLYARHRSKKKFPL
jgi:hypothetical protein